MPREKKAAVKKNGKGANLGFEATLWGAAEFSGRREVGQAQAGEVDL